MAIVKLGPVVVGLRGTTGGMTFSANKSGPYVKQWQRPKKVRSELQAATGNVMVDAAKLWATITGAQRADWDTWAAGPAPARFNSLGEPLVLSGFNWFVELSANLIYNGQTFNAPAPVLAQPAAFPLTGFVVEAVPAQISRVSFMPTPIVGFFTMLRVAQTRTNASNSFAQPNYYTFRRPDGQTNPIFLHPDLFTRWGEIQENRTWYLEAHLVNLEGLRGPAATAIAVT